MTPKVMSRFARQLRSAGSRQLRAAPAPFAVSAGLLAAGMAIFVAAGTAPARPAENGAIAIAPVPAEAPAPTDNDGEPELYIDPETGETVYIHDDGRRQAGDDVEGALEEQKKRMGWLDISFLALADGINPCAFASIVILVSMMATARRTRRETIVIGMSFTLAVFLAYMAIGLVFYKVLAELQRHGYNVVSDLVYLLAFLICVVCGVLSLWDAFTVWRRKDGRGMTLQLPAGFKRRIQKALSAGVRSSRLAAGTFFAGVMVSGLEAACTGQVFFPFVAQLMEENVAEAVLRLAWYCFVFIVPLIAVFVLALAGVTNQQLAGWMQRNLIPTKLLLAAVFILMGWLLWSHLKWPPGHRAGQSVGASAPPAVVEDE